MDSRIIGDDAVLPDTVDWLLAGDASIRWQTRRDLLDQKPHIYERDRAEVATTGWGRRLLECQDPGGTWGGGLYGPKWTSTTYTLLLLRTCGLVPGHPAALRGVELLWEGARYFEGGLTPAATVDHPEACVTSMYAVLARYFGFDDPRVAAALDWLLANQLEDGGWNCRAVRFGERHGSFHTSISVLEALAEAQKAEPARKDLTAAMARGRAFFLDHRLFKSHRDGTISDPAFTLLSFPTAVALRHSSWARPLREDRLSRGRPIPRRARSARRTSAQGRDLALAAQARGQCLVRHGTDGPT